MIELDKDDLDDQPVAETPLVDWKNKPTVNQLKQDLGDAKPIHDEQVNKITEYLDYMHITGKAKLKTVKGASNVQPKLIRKQAEWRYPALSEPFLSQDDIFSVKPVSWEDVKGARQNQILLNNQFNTAINKVKFIDNYVRTAVDEGTVILRTGWEFREETYLDYDYTFVVDHTLFEMHQELEMMRNDSPSDFYNLPQEMQMAHELTMETGDPIKPVKVSEEMTEKTRTVVNRPTVEICDTRNTVVDPTCMGDIKKANFVIRSFASSVTQLKKDGKYKNLEKLNLHSVSPLDTPDFSAENGLKNFQFSDEPRKKIIVWEYWGFWDINGDGITVPIVAAWVGDTMIRLEENPYPDKELPFIVVQYLPVRNQSHGEPDGALLVENQQIIGAVMRGAIDLMGKSANSQRGIRKDMLDASNKKKFLDGEDYEFNGGVDPKQGIHMDKFPEIPNSVPQMLMLQNQEAESFTGVKSFSQGVSGNSLGEVAAGVRGALDAASKREVAILRRLADGIIAVGRKWISMNAAFLEEKEVIRVTNDKFVEIKRDDLAGNYDMKLSISTAEEDEKKAQELAFMLQTMGNNMDPGMTKMILADIARLRKMVELSKKIEDYEPQPNPVEQKMQELQLMKLEVEIELERGKLEQARSQAALNVAKVETEAAKARNLDADSDNKDLEFVEQETGVNQEREIQKVGEQARSQERLAMVNHELELERMKKDPKKK